MILVLAIGGIFRLKVSRARPDVFLLLFVAASFRRDGQCPLRNEPALHQHVGFPLAVSRGLFACGGSVRAEKRAGALDESLHRGPVPASRLRQYQIFFVQNDLYELVPRDLLRAVKILK